MAVVILMSLSVPALAATGYGDGAQPNVPPFTPGRYRDASGGGGAVPAVAFTSATAAQVSAAASAAVQATPAGQRTLITFVNVSTVPAAAAQSVFVQAGNAMIHFDSRDGGAIVGRVYVDASTAAGFSGNVNVSVRTRGAEVVGVTNVFNRFFTNNVVVINLGQSGEFGTDVRVAVRADLSELNTDNLMFFAYSAETNRFSRIATTYRIDSNGFIHFITPIGGDIIITDRPFTLR